MYKDQIEKDEFGPAGLQVAIRGMNCENVREKKKKKMASIPKILRHSPPPIFHYYKQ